MKVLDLFSGIGGFSVGLEKAGFETVAFCEIEKYPRAVLQKHWPDIPIYDDIRELTAERLRADGIVPDVIVGGFPCQPFSVAGKQKAEDDPRHLWPEMFRLVRECRPRWVICENVSGLIKLGLDAVLDDLESEGYTVWPFVIAACAVGAPHKRDRLYIVANANSDDGRNWRSAEPQERQTRMEHRGSGERQLVGQSDQAMANANNAKQYASERTVQQKDRDDAGRSGENVANTNNKRFKRSAKESLFWERNVSEQPSGGCENIGDIWSVEPDVCRVVDGVQNRSHRIKGLGNAVVPQIPQIIGQVIMRYENGQDI